MLNWSVRILDNILWALILLCFFAYWITHESTSRDTSVFVRHRLFRLYSLEQITDASSLWPQFSTPHPLCSQSTMELSFPEQDTSSNQIRPLPWPKRAYRGALTASGYPSSRQTTLASFISQESSQTVPQTPLCKISTLPSPFQFPPTNLKPKTKRQHQVTYWPLSVQKHPKFP